MICAVRRVSLGALFDPAKFGVVTLRRFFQQPRQFDIIEHFEHRSISQMVPGYSPPAITINIPVYANGIRPRSTQDETIWLFKRVTFAMGHPLTAGRNGR